MNFATKLNHANVYTHRMKFFNVENVPETKNDI